MPAYPVPSLEDQHGFLLALFKVMFPDQDISRGSFAWLFLRTLAAGATDEHAHINNDNADLMPDTALGAMQVRWANLVGRPPKPATPARGSKALRVFGVALTPVLQGEQLISNGQLRYQVTTGDLVAATGYVDVDVAAIDVGSSTRLDVNDTLSFVNTPVGLEEQAKIVIALTDGGEDAESPGALQQRIVDRFRNPPLGGAQNDYATWALQVDDVAAAFEYPLRAGYGSVDVVALHQGTGTDRILTPTEVAIVQAYLKTKRPVSVLDCRVLQVNGVPTDVEYTVVSDGALEHIFDWDDAVAPTVLAWNAGTRELQFAGGSRPATLKAGDRLSIKPLAGGGTGSERVVEALSIAADTVVLEVMQGGDDPAAGDTIYAGGPLVEPTRQAILQLFDGLGTANPDDHRYGAWEGNLRPSAVGRVATAVTGVLDGTVVDPVATVIANDPPFPNDDTIELLVPRRVLVRAEH